MRPASEKHPFNLYLGSGVRLGGGHWERVGGKRAARILQRACAFVKMISPRLIVFEVDHGAIGDSIEGLALHMGKRVHIAYFWIRARIAKRKLRLRHGNQQHTKECKVLGITA